MEPVRRGPTTEAIPALSGTGASIRRAVIDVGTNSVKLLVADVAGREIRPVHEESKQTRLGKNFYDTHRLQPEAIAKTAEAVWEYAEIARERDAESIRVVATSAARDAINQEDLVTTVERASGLKMEIISGEQEAEWAFQGVTLGSDLAKTPLLLLDVGGGSTEFIVGHGKDKHFAESFKLGTVRMMEKIPHSDPPTAGELAKSRDWLKTFLQKEVRPRLEPVLEREQQSGAVQLAGTGGSATLLAKMELKLDRYDRDKIEAIRLPLKQIELRRKQLWKLSLAQRKEIPGLPKNRADVILTGILIYEAVMDEFGFSELRVSTRGLRFAALMD
ncbi:MAG TPA: Ppx/GppA phosphatase family protein [Desulfuromonadaceae bacterium]|nr:Ppx/GppA phosphatase family protein [Desulfuromonadaceae bacterium]